VPPDGKPGQHIGLEAQDDAPGKACGGGRDHQHHRPGTGQPDGQLLQAVYKIGPALCKGCPDAAQEALIGGGVVLHLAQVDVHGALLHLIAVPVQLALPALDLGLHVGQAGLDLQQVGQIVGLGLQLLQTGALGFQIGQPRFHVHVLGGHIVGLLALVGHIARLRHSIQKALVIFFRHTEGQVDAAAGPDV